MIFQPLMTFAAVVWALGFVAFGLYIALRRATPTFAERAVGLVASVAIAALGSGAVVGIMYLVEELL
jgi:putative copper export protein